MRARRIEPHRTTHPAPPPTIAQRAASRYGLPSTSVTGREFRASRLAARPDRATAETRSCLARVGPPNRPGPPPPRHGPPPRAPPPPQAARLRPLPFDPDLLERRPDRGDARVEPAQRAPAIHDRVRRAGAPRLGGDRVEVSHHRLLV